MGSTRTSMPESFGHQPAEPQRLGRGVTLGHEQAEDALGAERPRRQRCHDRAVDAAREAHDDAPRRRSVAQDLFAQDRG